MVIADIVGFLLVGELVSWLPGRASPFRSSRFEITVNHTTITQACQEVFCGIGRESEDNYGAGADCGGRGRSGGADWNPCSLGDVLNGLGPSSGHADSNYNPSRRADPNSYNPTRRLADVLNGLRPVLACPASLESPLHNITSLPSRRT